ncbi:MAG: cysteine dioxygenase [Actinomycetota bacterium]|nr:cysteine dioxygenase [Actinomycetota bacterium]
MTSVPTSPRLGRADESRATERAGAIANTMSRIRSIEEHHGITRESIGEIRTCLLELARRRDPFHLDDFPFPDSGRKACLYRLSEDDDHRFALYINSSGGGVSTPAHNHTTWAFGDGCESDGSEFDVARTGTTPGPSGVEPVREETVEAETGVAMLPDDLHSIHIEGRALNFHCYGLALEHLPNRQYYSESTGDWKVFPPSADIREARPLR